MKDIKITIDTSDVERAEKCFESLRLAALKATEAMKEFSKACASMKLPELDDYLFANIKEGDYVMVDGIKGKVTQVGSVSFYVERVGWFTKKDGLSRNGQCQAYLC